MSDSEQEDDSQKTEDPTPKKIEESRKRGQVAMSREINNWVMLFAATIVVLSFGPSAMTKLKDYLAGFLERSHVMSEGIGGVGSVLSHSLQDVLIIMIVPIVFLMMAAFLGPFLQIGPLFAPDIIKPDFSKISPMQGFKRLFSMRSIVEFIKGIIKLGIIGSVGVVLLMPYFDSIDHMVGLSASLMMEEMQILVRRLMMGILVVLLIVAVIDLIYQRFEHLKKMRMSKQELKDEYKQTEGDPHVRAKLKQLRQEKARVRMMQAVPTADVIITNPTHYSLALKYNPEEMDAPVLVAKGIDELAMRIREVAKEHKIPLYENRPLARALYDTLEVDDMIPPEHYKAVAEVISYVFQLKGKLPKPTA